MGTLVSPSVLMGSSRCTRRRSTVTPCLPRKSTMSCEVTEPKSLPSSEAWRRSSRLSTSMRWRSASASPFTRSALAWACTLMCSRFFMLPALALSASFLGIRKLRAKPSETSRTSPRRPTLATSSSRMTFMAGLLGRRVRQQRHRAGALDGVGELALVARAAARDPARDDLAALGHQAAQAAHVLVVDEVDLVSAELADLPPAEPAALDGLLNRGNRSALLLGGGTLAGFPPSLPVRTERRRRRRAARRLRTRRPGPPPARRRRRPHRPTLWSGS